MAKNTEHLPKRYAKALLEVILEMRGETGAEAIERQLAELADLCTGEVGLFFGNPVFDREEKYNVLEAVLSRKKIDPALDRFLRLLISLNHTHLLAEIAKAFVEVEHERKNEAHARVRTAFPLNKKDQERIRGALSRATGKIISLDVSLDKELIGGVVAEVGSRVFDASIRSFLDRLQEEF